MSWSFSERNWIEWLVKVRIIVITFLLVIELAIVKLTTTNVNERLFVGIVLAWYFFGGLYLWAVAAGRWHERLAEAQIATDLVFATAVIYVTGGIDTSFNFLYPLIIIVASALLSEAGAYLTAGLSFILFGSILELSYFNLIHSYSNSRTDLNSLQAVIFINLFAYATVAYLSNRLTTRLRQASLELADKSGALENLQALHENVVNAISGGLITTDLDGAVKLVNPAGRRLLDREGDDLDGVNIEQLFASTLPRPGRDSETTRVEVKARTRRGEERTFGISVGPLRVPIQEKGSPGVLREVGYVYTFNDLTEIRRLERELHMKDRLAAVGRLAAGIAHEIRNPLSSIAGSVKMLSKIATLTNDQRSLVDIVTRESERLNSIITDFLSYSRDRNYEMKPVDLRAKLEDTLTLLEHRRDEFDLDRNFTVREAYTAGDGSRLQQVFWNLCDNALRAMARERSQRGKLTVSLADAGSDWLVCFKDNGGGIAPKMAEKIFEPFQSGFEGGTGLGLAIVYQIMQAHNAQISVKTEQGKGSEFTLYFRKLDAAKMTEKEHELEHQK
ncbi:MAG TPA: ATP-binding protein [candidate division Zixibacteria bacterium]|nr:ATP-binding protein [candidate division Zixibacteria bacterium]